MKQQQKPKQYNRDLKIMNEWTPEEWRLIKGQIIDAKQQTALAILKKVLEMLYLKQNSLAECWKNREKLVIWLEAEIKKLENKK